MMPIDATLKAMSLSTNGNETWTAEIHVNGTLVTGATLASGGADSAYATGYTASFSAGDKVSFYINGTNIDAPMVTAWFTR